MLVNQKKFTLLIAGKVVGVSEENLRKHLQQITGPRHHNLPEAEIFLHDVEQYIQTELQELGYRATPQPFSFDSMTTAWGRSIYNKSGTNLIAEKRGLSDQVLLICTHHDTVPGSPGADDNASGVAGLIEIARILAPLNLKYTIRLISFDLEEEGLIGSEYYVQNLTLEEQNKILGMIMLEMIGYFSDEEQGLPQGFGLLYRNEIKRLKKDQELKGNFLTCIYRGDAKYIAQAFRQTETDTNLPVALIREPVDIPILGGILERLVPSLQNLLRSDHTPFWYRKIPAAMITDTSNFRYQHYHLPSDTIDKINFTGFTQAVERVLDAILTVNPPVNGSTS